MSAYVEFDLRKFEDNLKELKTGYPHKDKMWLKYYDSEFLKRKNPSAGIYDYMKEKTKNIQDYTALSYFGKKSVIW